MESVYISGPMTGRIDFNYPMFNSVAQVIRSFGYIVYNPAESFNGRTDLPKEVYMKEDIGLVLKSDCVVTLPDWEESTGAQLEVEVAKACGIPIIDLESFITNERGYINER